MSPTKEIRLPTQKEIDSFGGRKHRPKKYQQVYELLEKTGSALIEFTGPDSRKEAENKSDSLRQLLKRKGIKPTMSIFQNEDDPGIINLLIRKLPEEK